MAELAKRRSTDRSATSQTKERARSIHRSTLIAQSANLLLLSSIFLLLTSIRPVQRQWLDLSRAATIYAAQFVYISALLARQLTELN